jgi:hypothetical protein
MDELVRWLAPYLARFELPDQNAAPTDLPLALNAAFGLDFTGARLTQALAAAVQAQSGGRVFLQPAPRPPGAQREGAYLALSGQRRLLITAGQPVVEWLD